MYAGATTAASGGPPGEAFPAAATPPSASSVRPSSSFFSSSASEAFKELLEKAIQMYLPPNYDFEVAKSLRRLNAERSRHVALQLPEGLLTWSLQLASILKFFSETVEEVTILSDVTYGACCVDDLTADALGCDFLIHYGHSCLVPTTHASTFRNARSSSQQSQADAEKVKGLGCLYVFVDILVDPRPLCDVIKKHFSPDSRLALLGTIQYAKFTLAVKRHLQQEGYFHVPPLIPQRSPLTAGEVLGCTSPKLPERRRTQPAVASANDSSESPCPAPSASSPSNACCQSSACSSEQRLTPRGKTDGEGPEGGAENAGYSLDVEDAAQSSVSLQLMPLKKDEDGIDEVIFVADGRFHLEACMIQNPTLRFLRYDPFLKRLFRESYNHAQLHRSRQAAIEAARCARSVALLLSTLGRQGSVGILEGLMDLLERRDVPYCVILLSEISPQKIKPLAKQIDCFVQVACPRLSIDWGSGYAAGGRPVLTPYEAHVAFGDEKYRDVYPMDYYSKDGGPWSNYNTKAGHRSGSLAPVVSPQDRKAQLRARLLARQREQKSN
ncbi:putative diphthamide synthesis domain-containing protein [Neospora caninum Liverpool]|uniref:2-(3-amino-3-carboxypropyl)histidine synthase subunit 1 n=1 Tax=Neospora caninum (strain Liverpool) TaxID=572307 RepID=F0VGI9_NEOCL|nr:putative diphthamide synthesis domain-containing protein [Neospora caninum Liverpool]CBZ52833.1 putative diphthamide synthesis domain-containing protein [Neospora caninum Liverpool]CEL66813.1 TPA: putative diphthamide synthesis domain-containing protein [Neospora caninum Liverpool]|eukprot:XP_003882865.1 putative diphthamide synthesis domain-containing protein [Neospora caninum Liverpool]